MKKNKEGRTLSFGELFGYGAGGMFTYTFYNMLQAYFMLYFLTEVLGLSTVLAATIYSVTQWVKVITMILAGTIIDATMLKLGKYRSWILIGTVGVTIFATIMFLNLGLPTSAAIAVFLVAYVLQSLSYNLIWTASRALMGPMSKTSADAVGLASAAQTGTAVSGILYGLINTAIVAFWAKATGQGYGMTMLTYGLLMCVGCVAVLHVSKKYDRPETAAAGQKKEKIGFGTMLKSLRGPMIPYFLAMVCGCMQQGFFFALFAYFTQYVLQNPGAMGTAITTYNILQVISALIAPLMIKQLKNKKVAYIVFTACSGLMYLLLRIFGSTVVPFIIIYALVGFFGSPTGILLPAFANDLSDYQEMKGQKSARAFTQAIAGTSIRIGSVLSTMIASFGLAAIGYQTGTTPTPEILTGITNLMVVGPVIVCALACICIVSYHVDEKELDEFRAKRAAAAASAASDSSKA